MTDLQAPPGFGRLPRTSPFLDHVGPLYAAGQAPDMVIGFRVQAHHCNSRGGLHGGVLPAVADVLTGYNLALSHEPPRRLVTSALAIDYLGTASAADWIEARCGFRHEGARLAVAECVFHCDGRCIARATVRFLPA